MNKIYQRIDWENYPSSATPLNEDNLNKMDYAIDKLDDRVVAHETTKLDTATGNSLVKDVTFDEATGVFTIEKLSGSKITINTALEKISTNFHFNPTTQKLVLTLIDGTVQEIDLSALITQYEFLESDTITFEIDASGKVKANILNGSITGEKLEPNYLANVTLQAKNAKTSADNAKTSEELAYQYAEEARESASQAQVNDAANITYDNTESGLSATNVKDALDEVAQGSDSAVKDGDGNVITETYAPKNVDIYGDTLGVNTTIIVDGETVALLKVVYANNKFVALGKSDMFYSINGKDWFRCQGATEKNVKDGVLVCTPTGFVAIVLHNQYGYTRCLKSDDGINWTSVTYIVSNENLNNYLYYYIFSGVHGNGTIVFTGASRSNSKVPESFVYYSNDYGITWTKKVLDNASEFWYSIAYGNGIFMAVSDKGNYMYSSDGVSWTVESLGNTTLYDVIYENNKFVAVGGQKVYRTDVNGNTFNSSITISNASTLKNVSYGDGYYIVCDDTGRIFYSKDLISWTQSVSININPSSIAYNNRKFVVANEDNNKVNIYSFNKTSSDIEDAINNLVHRDDVVRKTSVLSTLTECEASTKNTDIAGASALAELTNVKTVTYSFLSSDIYDWRFYFSNVIQVGKLTIINGRIQSGVSVSLSNTAWIEVMQLSAKPTYSVYGICNSPNGKDVNFSSYIDGNGKLFITPDRELTNSGVVVDVLFAFQAV